MTDKFLTSEQFWKWRALILEMMHNREKLHNCALAAKIDQLTHEAKYVVAQQRLRDSEDEYDAYKKELEAIHEISLSSTSIDENTFQIRPLPTDNAKEP